ncbi:DUF7343 domain-containing protein [Halopiger djelfimassiliensis]|uniref:DUF7343 domain-containing protein n=1 Tax=Halopiger djelfimassiliensis TaxID=1293047 RepID=UPI000677FC06|nr:hypothetical protein [Halopiger djelfimassiliensis]
MNVRVGVTVAVVAVLLVGPMTAAVSATDAGNPPFEPLAIQQDEIDANEVRMDLALEPNGTAEWTLEFWVRLDDNESAAAFESLRAEIRENPDEHLEGFTRRMNDTVATASNATGREMTADGFDASAERQSFAREYGVVRYTFRWHGFAAVEGETLRAGDAIEGIYLDDGTRLLFEWPAGYELASVTPDPDDRRERAVIWRGDETDFVSGEPQLTVVDGGTGPSVAVLATVAVLAAGLCIAGAWWYHTRTAASSERTTDREPDRDADPATAAVDTPASSATGSPEPELLSNEEQVLRLLRDHGGRMKQQTVVEELGWTDAKTSKVVSGLREDGKLESFRLGRENVLSLPDEDEANPGGDGTA